jgi:hypothetical protein
MPQICLNQDSVLRILHSTVADVACLHDRRRLYGAAFMSEALELYALCLHFEHAMCFVIDSAAAASVAFSGHGQASMLYH